VYWTVRVINFHREIEPANLLQYKLHKILVQLINRVFFTLASYQLFYTTPLHLNYQDSQLTALHISVLRTKDETSEHTSFLHTSIMYRNTILYLYQTQTGMQILHILSMYITGYVHLRFFIKFFSQWWTLLYKSLD
jgi:hypothetical protein